MLCFVYIFVLIRHSIPSESEFAAPLDFVQDASEFIASELISPSVEKELRKMANVFPWIDDDSASTYFELALGNMPECMKRIKMIASKTYTRGLIIIAVYYQESVYFVIQNGDGDQPLLDVRFPDVSKHGQGLHINSYNDHTECWRKLTLWHILESEGIKLPKELPKIKTINVASSNYEQTYCILKSSWDSNSPSLSVHHDVLFRFGSWCYSGRVQLTPSLALADIPFVIPALRMQQSRLDYLCDVSQIPTTSPFAGGLQYMKRITPMIEQQIEGSEQLLEALIKRLTSMGLGESVSRWLEGDSSNSFFEFKIQPDDALTQKFKNMELIVSKTYYPSGVITITIMYQMMIYVCLIENNGESPLLDSKFPDVSGKGRGYQLQAYNDGHEEWKELRKVSIWQTVGALEQEFRDKASELASAKRTEDDERPEEALEGASFKADISAKCIDDNTSTRANYTASTKGEDGRSDSEVSLSMRADEKTGRSGTSSPMPGQQSSKRSSPAYASADAQDHAAPSSASAAAAAARDVAPMGTADFRGSSAASGVATSGSPNTDRRLSQALPHHVPKMAGLNSKMEELRKNMGDAVRKYNHYCALHHSLRLFTYIILYLLFELFSYRCYA